MDQEKVIVCPVCDGEGVVDSGGQTQYGTWINMTCPLCEGKPITREKVRECGFMENATQRCNEMRKEAFNETISGERT